MRWNVTWNATWGVMWVAVNNYVTYRVRGQDGAVSSFGILSAETLKRCKKMVLWVVLKTLHLAPPPTINFGR